MKILVISRNAWDDTNAIGNTLSNFFKGIENVEFASIYFRSSKPANNMCKTYYHTTEIEVIKKWFSSARIGKQFKLSELQEKNEDNKKTHQEKKLVHFIQKHKFKAAYKISDFIWYSERWINQKLYDFVKEFSPDLVVTFVKSAPQYYLTVKFLREKFNLPLFTWIADDEYTGLFKKHAKKEIRNLKYILDESSIVMGCSQEICDYYNSIFNCNASPLYKSCDLSIPVKKREKDPITIVYAGNLLYGRLEIIGNIVEVLESMHFTGHSLSVEVYSNTYLSEHEIQKHFGNRRVSKYMGRRDYSTIKERLSTANIVLHVESFENEEILKTKYSFSTKIIDYLQSGALLLAVGPSEIASMRYISKIPGTYVINDLSNMPKLIEELLLDSSNFSQRALKTRDFAEEHHDSRIVNKKIEEMFNKIIEKGV